jgi:hypothetical protein
MKRFFIDQDHDCHWYIVPEEKKIEWEEWRNLPEDNESSWETPDFAKCINGPTNIVMFTNPQIIR